MPRRCAASSTSPASCRCSRNWSPARSSASQEVADQLRDRARTPTTKFARGIAFLALGLAKKVLLANPCGKIADLAFDAGSLAAARRLVRRRRVRVPDLLRLQRLLGHGDRPRSDARLRVRQELRLALPRAVDHRVLAPLAHLAVDLAARLPLRAARRQSQRDALAPTST